MYTEIKEGRGGPHDGVFADMTYHGPGFIARMQPALCETYEKIGIDPEKDHLEVAPTCHFFMGGAKVDENWQSTVSGLFVVGENAAGIQGANRLSQNALPELLVSGKHAGKAASRLAGEISQAPVDPREAQEAISPVHRLFARDKGVRPVLLRKRLRRLMWEEVGVYRTESGLKSALRALEKMKDELNEQYLSLKSRHYNQELVQALENDFLVSTAQCVTEAALQRTESRGAHYREDYPETDHGDWLRHLVLRQKDGKIAVETIPVDLREMSPEEAS
jgi:succinate dehydrogenase/fumarate reductase flavoprotein subunit